MKKFLKSLSICIGIFIINFFIGGLVSVIFGIVIGDSNEFNQYRDILIFITDIITLILVHLILLWYNQKLLSKATFKKIKPNEAINISLLGVGISIILSTLTGILSILIPSYTNIQNQFLGANNSLLQLGIVILLIPIYEEIIFRYVIFGYLKENYNIVCAIIGQALVFGFFHLNIVQGIYTFLLGIALALVYMYSESLVGSIILHVIFNLFGTLIIPKFAAINPMMQYVIIIFGIVCLVISILKILKKYEGILYK
ncbi:MAG: CPBP family intramembrane glutamic endopeptidase [Paeniclostridium sordellii]|uniref:CPBP family intramembrane metalloprotease n=1 Tax=Paeniclostridium hominis TaxID=2764329 RepID=A0ABR7K7D2_9FIRM|nr:MULTISPECIES: CPBP family intramembrane glutamic endopeptidase [Paeniclostridium]MBC6005011.1 CPBP family intramembrane metalloprotease [Paeniclostridium hominis]MDU2592179.1 CPBP family intramembrane glutamic endopeptidase [Paeniclostridium sordellii]